MDRLESSVLDFIRLEESDEYKKAAQIVKLHTSALEYIKRTMRERGIRDCSVNDGGVAKTLTFLIRKQERVDVKALPMDIRKEYLTEAEVWIRSISR